MSRRPRDLRPGRSLLLALLLSTSTACVDGDASGDLRGTEARPSVDALADSIVDLWDDADLVCLGETHGSRLDAALREAVVDHPRFVDTVEVVVVEFVSAARQDLLDRLVREPRAVTRRELAPAWRDAGAGALWELPAYERFLRRIAERNVATTRPVRIVGASLPIDWSSVETADDLAALPARSDHFAEVLQREILAPGRRGLAILGRAHCERSGATLSRLERRRIRSVLAVDPQHAADRLDLAAPPRTIEFEQRSRASLEDFRHRGSRPDSTPR